MGIVSGVRSDCVAMLIGDTYHVIAAATMIEAFYEDVGCGK